MWTRSGWRRSFKLRLFQGAWRYFLGLIFRIASCPMPTNRRTKKNRRIDREKEWWGSWIWFLEIRILRIDCGRISTDILSINMGWIFGTMSSTILMSPISCRPFRTAWRSNLASISTKEPFLNQRNPLKTPNSSVRRKFVRWNGR